MFGWRSARGRAVLAGVVFMLLLAAVAGVAVWRGQSERERLDVLERRAAVVAALEDARAQSFRGAAAITAAVFAEDASPHIDTWRQANAKTDEELDGARAGLVALGDTDGLAALNSLTEQSAQMGEEVEAIVDFAATADVSTRIAVGQQYYPDLWPRTEAQLADLDQLAEDEQNQLAAERAAADRAASVTLWLLVGFSTAAFVGGAAALAMLIASVVRPLASLRASVRTVASGDLEARARVSGPQEVASLARDFNQMVLERRQVEEALRESDKRYRSLFDRSLDAVYVHDFEGRFLDANEAALRLLGYSRDEIPKLSFADLLDDSQLPAALASLEEIRKTGTQPMVTTFKLRRKDGGFVEVETLAAAVYEGDRLVGVQGIARDLSERRRMEEALRESEERYRDLFENANDLIQSVAPDGSFVYVNRAWREALGYSEEEIAGLSLLNIVHPDSKAYCTEMFQRVIAGEKLDGIEAMFVTKEGGAITVEGSANCRFEDGKPVATRGIFRDITERRRAEERVEHLNSVLRAISNVNQLLVKEKDRERMLKGVCDSLVETRGYYYAWIAVVDESGGLITSVEAGLGKDFLAMVERLKRGELPDCGRRALVQSGVVTIEDPGSACRDCPLAAKYGRAGAMIVRLEYGGKVCGLLGVSIPAEFSADAEERSLLGEVAGDIAFALHSIQLEEERKRAEEALREQVRRDPLTGVLNHAAIVEELRGLISDRGDGASHAVAMVDVNDLKVINDTYGHQVGDAVLVAVADAVSREGAIVGRYGGDEFVAVLPGADREEGERYREEVLDTLAGARVTDAESGASVAVVASIGLATYPTEAERIEELIKLADSDMYAAKRQRPVGPAHRAVPRPLAKERAAKMLGELVPLLTSPGDLNEKLRLVAHRLSSGAGYDGVAFAVLFGPPSEAPTAQNAFGLAPDEVIEGWNRENRRIAEHPLRPTLERTQRPIILDDPQHDQRLTESEKKLVRAAGIQSLLVAPMIWRNRVAGHLSVTSTRKGALGPRDAEFLMAVASQVTAIVRMSTLIDRLKSTSARLAEAQTETVMLLAAAAEAHDQTTGLHLRSVRAVTEALARELGYGEKDARELGLAAVLHDIGKVRVPNSVLASTGRLAEEEWELLKHHTGWGGHFLAERPGFELAAVIARSHHEHWDGSGYPDGLSGEAIPEVATIVAVADAFDAMTAGRPYRAARSVAAAVREIVACSGRQFSPRVVQALVQLHKRRVLSRLRRQGPAEAVAA